MKKGLLFFTSLCAMALALAGCDNKGGGDGKKYNVSITNKDAISEIFEDDTSKSVSVQIDGVITADAYQKGDLVVTSSNTDVLEISGNNKLSPIEAGQVTVTATYKKKFSDSVDINVKLQKALQPVSDPQEGEDYILCMTPANGKRNYAVGGMDGSYLKSGIDLEKAATARVILKETRDDSDFKYKITLTWKTDDGEVTKTIGSYYGVGTDGKNHTSIGYVEDDDKFQIAWFKINEDLSYSTMVTVEGTPKEYWIGTYSTYTTFSYRDASQIAYKAQLFGMLDPIHCDTVSIDQEDVKIKAGGVAKLSATLTPDNCTDTVTWYSKNQSVATVDAATGLVVGKAEGTAEIVAKARPRHEASIVVTVEGELDYGTEENPLSVTEAKALLDDGFADGTMTPNELYVTGKVSSATYNDKYKNWTIWLYDGEEAEGFELYATELASGIDGEKLLDGATVKAYGLAKIMTTSAGAKIYELSNKGSDSNPKVYSLEPAALEGIAVNPSSCEINIYEGEQTKQFSVKPLPAAAELPETCDWAVAPTGEGAFITDAGELTIRADAVAEGGTKEYTVTAICGGFQATSKVTVINDSGKEDPFDAITVAEAIALDPGEGQKTDFVYVKGLIKSITNATYGNGYLKSEDGSDELEIYGMYNADKSLRYDKLPADEKPVVDDEVILMGKVYHFHSSSADKLELENAQIVSLKGVNMTVLTGLALPATLEVEQGSTAKLDYVRTPSGATMPEEVSWASDNEAAATVANGVVTGVATDKGTATITLTAGEFTATSVVTVKEASAPSFELTTTLASGKYVIGALGSSDNTQYYYLGAPTGTVSKNPSTSGPLSNPASQLKLADAWDVAVDGDGHIVISYTVETKTYYLEATNAAQGIKITDSQTANSYWTLDSTGLQFNDGGTRYMATYNDGSFRYYSAPLGSGQSMANVFYHYIGE